MERVAGARAGIDGESATGLDGVDELAGSAAVIEHHGVGGDPASEETVDEYFPEILTPLGAGAIPFREALW